MKPASYRDLGIFGSIGPRGFRLVKPWLWLAHWRARRALRGAVSEKTSLRTIGAEL